MGNQGIAYERGVGELISIQVAMRLLGDVSKSTVYRLKDEGKLGPVYKIGKSVRVTRMGVLNFLYNCIDI